MIKMVLKAGEELYEQLILRCKIDLVSAWKEVGGTAIVGGVMVTSARKNNLHRVLREYQHKGFYKSYKINLERYSQYVNEFDTITIEDSNGKKYDFTIKQSIREIKLNELL